MEEEAHADLVGRGERAAVDSDVGDQFPGQGGGVVGDAVEVGAGGGQVGEAKEGQHAGVGAELDVELVLVAAGDGVVEGRHDLAGDDGAGHGADGLGLVVRQAPFVLVGQGAELEEGLVGE